jgi:hypothetical protein
MGFTIEDKELLILFHKKRDEVALLICFLVDHSVLIHFSYFINCQSLKRLCLCINTSYSQCDISRACTSWRQIKFFCAIFTQQFLVAFHHQTNWKTRNILFLMDEMSSDI